MRKISTLFSLLVFCSLLQISADAQLPLSPDAARVSATLFNSSSPDSLRCDVERWNPDLDFAFRFVSGYVAYCRLSQFGGRKTLLLSFLRITPEGKPPSFFGSAYRLPEMPVDLKESTGKKLKTSKNVIGVSGAVALGEGRYSVELLIRDDQNRSFRKKWKLHVSISRNQRGVALAMKPLTVESIDEKSWETVSSQRNGKLRLTILLDAAPIYRYQSTLHAWDRALLLESVYSVLRQTPHDVAHVVAFNLEQQRELLRSDQFDSAAFQALARALSDAELSSISVNSLRKRDSPGYLISLANQELAADRSDAIIFIGPNARMDTQMTAAVLASPKTSRPPFFYFEYFPSVGAPFPDSIDWLVKASGGRVFQVHSPAELDQSIDRMLIQLKQR